MLLSVGLCVGTVQLAWVWLVCSLLTRAHVNHRQHFRLAIKADPKDSVVLADYAQFLKSVRKVRCLPCRRNAKL